MELTKIAFHVRHIPSHTPKQSFQHFAQTGSFPYKTTEWWNSRPPHTKKLQNTHTHTENSHSLPKTRIYKSCSSCVCGYLQTSHIHKKSRKQLLRSEEEEEEEDLTKSKPQKTFKNTKEQTKRTLLESFWPPQRTQGIQKVRNGCVHCCTGEKGRSSSQEGKKHKKKRTNKRAPTKPLARPTTDV